MKDLNLIPKSYIEQKKKRKKRLVLSLCVFAGAVILLAAVALPLSLSMSIKNTRDSMEQTVIAAKGDANTLAQLNSIKLLYDHREKESAAITKINIKITELLEKIEQSSPEKLFVSSLSFSGGTTGEPAINLSGIASSENEIATFVSSLRKESVIENIIINSVKNQAAPEEVIDENNGGMRVSNTKSTDEGYTFTVNIYLKK